MSQPGRYVFLIDDEPIQNEMIKDYLTERFTYEIKVFDNGEAALQQLHLHPEIVVLDYHLGSSGTGAKNGIEILQEIKKQSPDTQVIMLSGQDKIGVAVDSMRLGAYDYVVKGETAFSRTENIINNLGELHKARTLNKAYKRTITILTIGISACILIALYLAFFRYHL